MWFDGIQTVSNNLKSYSTFEKCCNLNEIMTIGDTKIICIQKFAKHFGLIVLIRVNSPLNRHSNNTCFENKILWYPLLLCFGRSLRRRASIGSKRVCAQPNHFHVDRVFGSVGEKCLHNFFILIFIYSVSHSSSMMSMEAKDNRRIIPVKDQGFLYRVRLVYMEFNALLDEQVWEKLMEWY